MKARFWIPYTLVAILSANAAPEPRPTLVFREDWKEIPEALPVSPGHVANPDLVLGLHGPGRDGIKKSNHPKIPNDPYYIWSGMCAGNWAVSLKHRAVYVDLTGRAKIRWRSQQAGFRQLRIILRLADGTWLVGDACDGPAADWREREFVIADIRWRRLNIETVIEGAWARDPDLSRVDEIGFTDLMPGGGSPACSRLDWIEVWGKAVPR